MKVLIDENLPPALAKLLHVIADLDGNSVSHVFEIGRSGSKDVDLFDAIARDGFQVHITLDHHHRKQVERDAIASAGLIVFVLATSWDTQPLHRKAAQLLLWWQRLMDEAAGLSPPAVFRVPWKIQGKGKLETIRNVQRARRT